MVKEAAVKQGAGGGSHRPGAELALAYVTFPSCSMKPTWEGAGQEMRRQRRDAEGLRARGCFMNKNNLRKKLRHYGDDGHCRKAIMCTQRPFDSNALILVRENGSLCAGREPDCTQSTEDR